MSKEASVEVGEEVGAGDELTKDEEIDEKEFSPTSFRQGFIQDHW